MRRRRRSRTDPRGEPDRDFDRALEAMTAPELRSFVRTVVDGLDDDRRITITDSLVARAQGPAGWKPSTPSARVVDEVCIFADAARTVAYADPDEVSDYLRKGTRAFLAGDHATARAVFEALLLPVAQGEINLGQHEMVEEVLNVDLHVTVAQYVTSVYTPTALCGRPNAVYSAITRVEGVATLANPIGDMESVSAGALPDLGLFLPRWVKRLERMRPKDEWEGAPERWLREAVFRMDGVEGLERLARKTKRPQAFLAWCEALAERGDWPTALRAYDAAAKLVGKSPWRGELLDGAALAAQQLGRSDVVTRLEAAWVGAPSLVRLLRWLAAPGPPTLTLVTKAGRALKQCPKTEGRQVGASPNRQRRSGRCSQASGRRTRARVVQGGSSRAPPFPGICHPARRGRLSEDSSYTSRESRINLPRSTRDAGTQWNRDEARVGHSICWRTDRRRSFGAGDRRRKARRHARRDACRS